MTITAEKLDIRHAFTGDLKAISARMNAAADAQGVVLIVNKASAETLDALGRSLEVFAQLFSETLRQAEQATLDQLVALFVPKVPVSSNLLREAQMLAKAKKAVLESGDWVSAAEIAKLGAFRSSNPSSQPNKWKREQRLFAIRHNGVDYFPVYGLDKDAAYRPLPAMREVIKVLEPEKSGWGMAYWFASVNSYLGGKRPQDLLSRDPQRVIAAAREEAAGVTHG
jgi:hypothetical protein